MQFITTKSPSCMGKVQEQGALLPGNCRSREHCSREISLLLGSDKKKIEETMKLALIGYEEKFLAEDLAPEEENTLYTSDY